MAGPVESVAVGWWCCDLVVGVAEHDLRVNGACVWAGGAGRWGRGCGVVIASDAAELSAERG